MQSYSPKRLSTLMLVLVLGVSPALAQDDTGVLSEETPTQLEETESGKPDPKTQEQKEKNADVREAVLENLDLKEIAEESFDSEDVSPLPEDPSLKECRTFLT
jgi:hypothetical protein